jgi:hypothetical protein
MLGSMYDEERCRVTQQQEHYHHYHDQDDETLPHDRGDFIRMSLHADAGRSGKNRKESLLC